MKKKINQQAIINELTGNSAFFKKPVSESTPPMQNVDHVATQNTGFAAQNRSIERTESRSEIRTLPIKRKTKRYSFEFYDDQLTSLKRLKYEAEIAGEALSLSDIVRQALDEYLKNLPER